MVRRGHGSVDQSRHRVEIGIGNGRARRKGEISRRSRATCDGFYRLSLHRSVSISDEVLGFDSDARALRRLPLHGHFVNERDPIDLAHLADLHAREVSAGLRLFASRSNASCSHLHADPTDLFGIVVADQIDQKHFYSLSDHGLGVGRRSKTDGLHFYSTRTELFGRCDAGNRQERDRRTKEQCHGRGQCRRNERIGSE